MNKVKVEYAVPPFREVEYFQEKLMTFRVTNIDTSKRKLLIVSVGVRFESDFGFSTELVEQLCTMELEPNEMKEQEVKISPTPYFQYYTNMFDVMVKFHVLANDRARSQSESETFKQLSHIIVKPSSRDLGQLFISFKQPEDHRFAVLLQMYSERAGFRPYLALGDSQPGIPLWKRILRQLRKSGVVFIIWTKNTAFGTGVLNELNYCSKHKIPFVLLLENGASLPPGYDESLEYERFDRNYPNGSFSEAISSRRNLIVNP